MEKRKEGNCGGFPSSQTLSASEKLNQLLIKNM